MDTTIRNLDKDIYRALKAHAALAGKTIGQVMSEAGQAFLALNPVAGPKRGSLRALTPTAYPEGTERLSEELDRIVYGA
jgi:hypothetical protein